MIKVDRGAIEIKGTLAQLSAETHFILKVMYERVLIKNHGMDAEQAKEYIQNIVESSFLNDEEIRKKTKEEMRNFFNEMLDGVLDRT